MDLSEVRAGFDDFLKKQLWIMNNHWWVNNNFWFVLHSAYAAYYTTYFCLSFFCNNYGSDHV